MMKGELALTTKRMKLHTHTKKEWLNEEHTLTHTLSLIFSQPLSFTL